MLDAIDEHDGIRVSAKQRPLYYKRLPDLNRATVAPHGRRLRPAHAEGLPVRPRVNAVVSSPMDAFAPPAQCSASCCPRRNAVRAPRVC